MKSYILQLTKNTLTGCICLAKSVQFLTINRTECALCNCAIVQPQGAVQLSPWFSLLPVWKDDFLCKDVLCADLKEVFHTHMHVAHVESVARPD